MKSLVYHLRMRMKNENEKEEQQETLETSESFSSVEVIYVEGVDKPSPQHVDCLLITKGTQPDSFQCKV